MHLVYAAASDNPFLQN